jgi:hypothetical protein
MGTRHVKGTDEDVDVDVSPSMVKTICCIRPVITVTMTLDPDRSGRWEVVGIIETRRTLTVAVAVAVMVRVRRGVKRGRWMLRQFGMSEIGGKHSKRVERKRESKRVSGSQSVS